MKYILGLLLLGACASKPIIVKDCQKVEGDKNMQVCMKL
jgi:hypothetical protein